MPQVDVSYAGEVRNTVDGADVTNSQATLRLETGDNLLIAITNTAKLVIGLGIAYLFYLLRQVVQSIHVGEPFSARGVAFIRRLGLVTLALGVLVP